MPFWVIAMIEWLIDCALKRQITTPQSPRSYRHDLEDWRRFLPSPVGTGERLACWIVRRWLKKEIEAARKLEELGVVCVGRVRK